MRTIDLDDNSRVIVLGEGQVGSAISRSFLRARSAVGHQRRTDWASPEKAARSTTEALDDLQPPSSGPALATGRITVVWSAGTAGMTTSKERCDQNLATMKSSISAALESVEADRQRSLHIVSSAGAYAHSAPRWPSSGAPSVGDSSAVDVPYIQLKMAEEQWAQTLTTGPNPIDTTIHRVASVYARPDDPGRSGMVAAMVRNASRGKVTPIFGNWSTMRNYVHADDVGEFVARSVRFGDVTPGRCTETLIADRRSYAISELVQLVSRVIRRPVPLQMIAADNAQNHTFNPSMIADGFAARSLPTAIRQMFVDLQT